MKKKKRRSLGMRILKRRINRRKQRRFMLCLMVLIGTVISVTCITSATRNYRMYPYQEYGIVTESSSVIVTDDCELYDFNHKAYHDNDRVIVTYLNKTDYTVEPSTVYVRKGDTLWSIALKYVTNDTDINKFISKMEKINDISGAIIQPGMTLTLPLQ